MKTLDFFKYQAAGNDFILIDNRHLLFPATEQEFVAKLCQRRFGIGADGLILLEYCPEADFRMRYYNADGKEASFCGNGARAFTAFAFDLGLIEAEQTCSFLAADGMHQALYISKEEIRLAMRDVQHIEKRGEKQFFLDTGSPHLVCFYPAQNLITEARALRYASPYVEAGGVNVNFAEKLEANAYSIRTYERGVEDETLACGTGATALALAALYKETPKKNQNYRLRIETRGARLFVSCSYTEAGFQNIELIGPAQRVFCGELDF